MQSRLSAAAGVMACVLLLALASGAGAADFDIAIDGSGDYLTLKELWDAANDDPNFFHDGDSIILHNDDSSLEAPIDVKSNAVTLKSQGGDYTVSSFDPQSPHEIINYGATTGGANLTIENLIIRNSGPGIRTTGSMDITITNTSFKNTDALSINTAALSINTAGGNVTLQINVDSNAVRRTVTWDGRSTGIEFEGAGSADMTVDVAAGKKLDIQDDVNTKTTVVDFVKTGAGTLSLGGTLKGNTSTKFYINEGTLHLGEYASVTGGTMNIASGAVFKPSLTVGDLLEGTGESGETEWNALSSRVYLNEFTAKDGARLEIGNASTFPQFSSATSQRTAAMPIVMLGSPNTSSVLPEINNGLMRAKLYKGDSTSPLDENVEADAIDSLILRIYYIKNLNTLNGIGGYADVYRKLILSEGERDMLDSIYARGDADDFAMGYLQTLSGAAVMNASVAMRHNLAGVLRAISKRSTVFQKEELEPEVTGSDYIYDDSMPTLDYGQIWAYIDKSWSSQEELGNIAGYRYNPYGIGIGYEWHRDEWIYGGVLRHDSGDMELDRNRDTKTEIQSIIGSLYASWASDGYYATGGIHLGYGWNKSTSAYNTPWDSGLAVTGNYGSSLYGASLEIGRMVHLDAYDGDFPVRVTPYAGLAYARINREAVTESGTATLNKHFRQSVWNMWEYSAGVRVSMPLEYFSFTLIPSVDAAIVRTMGTPNNDHGDANLIYHPGSSWKVSVWDSNRTALRLNSSVNARFHNNLDVGVSYDFEWRKKAWNHQLSMNMSLGF